MGPIQSKAAETGDKVFIIQDNCKLHKTDDVIKQYTDLCMIPAFLPEIWKNTGCAPYQFARYSEEKAETGTTSVLPENMVIKREKATISDLFDEFISSLQHEDDEIEELEIVENEPTI